MKHVLFISMAAGLLLAAGCTKKNEEGGTCPMGAEEVAVKTPETPAQVEETVEIAAEKVVENTQKAVEATQQVAKEATTAIAVKAEDVMDDLNQSVAEIKQKVSGFDQAQLLAYADQYKDVILEKKDQLVALGDKVKGLSMTELLGEKGKALKNQLAQYTDQLGALKDRYEVYLGKLKEFGVDLSGYGL